MFKQEIKIVWSSYLSLEHNVLGVKFFGKLDNLFLCLSHMELWYWDAGITQESVADILMHIQVADLLFAGQVV